MGTMTLPQQTNDERPWRNERFQLLRRLGAGGMGVVYEAFDTRRQLKVALKTLRQLSPENTLALKREFRSISQLRHPNLIRYYDLVVSSKDCFFTMELLDGLELLAFLQKVGATPEYAEHFYSVLLQLSAALDVLHQSGIVHRDLKPSNVLVSPKGQIRLLDFGIAQSLQAALEEDGDPVVEGTPHYMSPEQIRGRGVTPASDLYSFGVVLYLLLTGRPPFTGKTTRQILMGHVQEPPPLPSAFSSAVAPELEALCLSLLSKEPTARPTAKEVVHHLSEMSGLLAPTQSIKKARFVGRAKELQELSSRLTPVEQGGKSAVVCIGESGAGKSALCAEFIRSLPNNHWKIITGRCYEREDVAYNAIDPLIDVLSTALRARPMTEEPEGLSFLRAIFPQLGEGGGVPQGLSATEGKRLAKEALSQLVAHYAKGKPILFLNDDLQWADQDSLDLLESLFSMGSSPLFLLGTMRAQATPSASVHAFCQEVGAHQLKLSPFGESEIRELCKGADDAFISQIVQETRGNAFFATELAAALSSGVKAAKQGGLTGLLLSRVERLPPPQRAILRVLAVSGASASFAILKELTELPSNLLAESLDALLAEHWLKVVDTSGEEDAYDIYHDRIRESIYDALPEDQKRSLHLCFAELLSEEYGEPESVAGHFVRAGELSKAAPWFLAAARKAASQLAVERATQLYDEALRAGGESWPEEKVAKQEKALTLDRAGARYAEAAAAYREAAAATSGEPAARLLVRGAEAELREGRLEAALATVAQAMSPYQRFSLPESEVKLFAELAWHTVQIERYLLSLKELPHRPVREDNALLHFIYARIGTTMLGFAPYRAALCSNRGLSLALAQGSDEDVIDSLSLYALFMASRRGRKNIQRAQALYEKARRWRHVAVDPDIVVWVGTSADGFLHCLRGQFTEAITLLQSSLEQYRAYNRVTGIEIIAVASFLGCAEAGAGLPLEEAKRLETFIERAKEEKDPFVLRGTVASAVWLWLLRGALQKASAWSSLLPVEAYSAVSANALQLTPFLGALYLAQGAPYATIDLLERYLSSPVKNYALVVSEAWLRARLFLATALLQEAHKSPSRERRGELLKEAKRQLQKVIAADDAVLEGPAFRLMSYVEYLQNNPKGAQHWIDRAIASLSVSGEAIELAAALLGRAAIAGASQDKERAETIIAKGGFLHPFEREGLRW